MATEVIMPKVDMDMTEGKIAYWYVKDGDRVAKGQTLFDIETDKATMEVEAPANGVIRDINTTLGEPIPVGQPVAWIFADNENHVPVPNIATSSKESVAPVDALQATSQDSDSSTEVAPTTCPADSNVMLRATPLARSLAKERGIDLAKVYREGHTGRIYASDIASAKTISIAQADEAVLHLNWLSQTKTQDPPVLMLHGFGADQGGWRPLATLLNDLRIIAIDLPNHGKSPPMLVNSLGAMAIHIIETLNRAGIDQFHLLGHSMGASVAMEVSSIANARVKSLTLLAPAGLGPDINGAFLDGLCRASTEASLRPWLSQLFGDERLLSASFSATAFKQLESPDTRAALHRMAQLMFPDGTQAHSQRHILQELTMPTRVIWGDTDRIIPASHARGLPGRVALHLLQAVGHLPHIEAAEMVAEIVRQQVK